MEIFNDVCSYTFHTFLKKKLVLNIFNKIPYAAVKFEMLKAYNFHIVRAPSGHGMSPFWVDGSEK